jgi:DNA-binding response OmpR family regulator
MGRILIADTDKPTRDLVRRRFTAWGHDVVCYADGLSALQATRTEDFDMVLIDEDLPRMCGLDVLRSIRLEQTRRVTVVLLAQNGHRGIAAAAYELGADEVAFKPFTLGFMTTFSNFLVSEVKEIALLEAVAG